MRFFKRLPDDSKLFRRFLAPWYPESDRRTVTRPDMYIIAGYGYKPIDIDSLQYLPPLHLREAREMVDIMTDAARGDFQNIVAFDDFNLDVLDAVDRFHTREIIGKLIRISDPKDFGNAYLVSVCEFGAMLGAMFVAMRDYEWLYSWPYFNSIVVHTLTGWGIPVFEWSVKKFSEYGIEDGYVGKFEMAIKSINNDMLLGT